jgi:hypothetical protein
MKRTHGPGLLAELIYGETGRIFWNGMLFGATGKREYQK